MKTNPNRFAGNVARIALVLVFVLVSLVLLTQHPDQQANASTQAGTSSPDSVWRDIDEKTIGDRQRLIVPQAYRTIELNQRALFDILDRAPMEFTDATRNSSITLSLPFPDGSYQLFKIELSPIMEPQLAAQFPQIRTFRGQSLDDPAAVTRLGWTLFGFHAIILSPQGTVYIDPYGKDDQVNYTSYFKRDYRKDGVEFQCLFTEDSPAVAQSTNPEPNVLNGTALRTYRLALAATVEYSAVFGGTVPLALSAMTTTMNRVNGIYEREVAVHMNLVANEASIIFTAEPDGYTNSSGSTMLGQNQSKLDTVIGTANYDVGHVFSTGGGGVAGLGVICSAGNKARGVTGLPSPVGDAFAVDYVAHEMGHQFGGLHTFNGITTNCGGGNRSASAAYEPGSASTIMGYAGICGAQNLQPHSDDYFHVKSLEQIVAHITSGGGSACAASTMTGNTPPTVNAGSDYKIPKSTPFTLTATGSDVNGDSVTYCWEEYDLSSSSPPDTDADGVPRPIFRSFNPVSGPSRTFPKLSDILGNVATYGEALPAITRTMTFQVTARDNRALGGGVSTDTALVNVVGTSGPFVVTQPNTAVSWTGGTAQTVTWDVANSNIAPVNCSLVKISLSTDGGGTFPIVLSSGTANDGTELITVPAVVTATARIKVEALGNIFFDVSNANFSIVAGCPAATSPTSLSFTANGGSGSSNITAAADCNWTPVNNTPSFITLTSGSGTGNGIVNFNVAVNGATTPRTGSITVGLHTITVAQGAAFLDVPVGHLFYTEIGKLSARGITSGCNGGNYCPDDSITREQMAAFIVRAAGDFNPPLPPFQRFTDVLPANPFYPFIDEMAVRQITVGCGGTNYCPGQSVPREQMAAFIVRALGEFNPPMPLSQRFLDVPPANGFYNFIDRLAALQITQGCGGGNFCPGSAVTRGQMAAFLVRAFNL